MFDEESGDSLLITFGLGQTTMKGGLARSRIGSVGVRASVEKQTNTFLVLHVRNPHEHRRAAFVRLTIRVGSL